MSNGPATTYFLETFGCQMNILDSQLVEGQLRARGMVPVASFQQADLILFNTCSVRQHAEDKVLSRLGELKALKRRRPDAILGVIGCMAEREKEGLFLKAPHVDLLCGPGELNRLPALLDEVTARNEQLTALTGAGSRRTEALLRALEYDSLEALDLSRRPLEGENVLQSYVRVQRGCDKFCTYCVVPFTRGAERSRPPAHIVAEARTLAQRGCREITLLGQTVNSYVYLEDGCAVPFARLLERVHEVEGIDRIRFVTSFPADWDEDIFRVMRDFPRVMPYLHIPAQSGADSVLKRMRRTYTADAYRRLMDTARRHVPHIALAGDFIVGFCGETDAEHRESLRLVRDIEYSTLFVFRYSPRPGTAADRNQDDDVPDDVKAARNAELLEAQREISLRLRRDRVGSTLDVLIEGYSKLARKAQGELGSAIRTRQMSSQTFRAAALLDRDEPAQESEQDRGGEVSRQYSGQLVGRTPQDQIVVLDGPADWIGGIARVRIESATPQTLFGRVIELSSAARAAAPAACGVTSLPIVG